MYKLLYEEFRQQLLQIQYRAECEYGGDLAYYIMRKGSIFFKCYENLEIKITIFEDYCPSVPVVQIGNSMYPMLELIDYLNQLYSMARCYGKSVREFLLSGIEFERFMFHVSRNIITPDILTDHPAWVDIMDVHEGVVKVEFTKDYLHTIVVVELPELNNIHN